MDIEQRLEDLENSVSYLLTEVEGKPKLIKLIDALQKDNAEFHVRCDKLIRENVALKEKLSQQESLIKKLRLIVDDEKKSFVLEQLTCILDLLENAELEINNLLYKFRID
ncbi:hypothetical protein [Microcoleus sp. B4-C1]|uniref:hypothetical protein n=1 Tax=Microcoleus sp. B4-C1 TaxID=2818660 RepID=UPI002FD004D3